MTATATIERQPEQREDRLTLPHDLSEWVEKETLLEWTVGQIEILNWENPQLVKYLETHPQYRPKTLLRLLSFCYATGVFAAEDIEANCFSDVFCRFICESDPPLAREISRFRRENRGLLKWLLAELLKQVLKKKFNLGNTLFPAGLRRFVENVALERLDLARHLDRAGHEM
jgi:transposase